MNALEKYAAKKQLAKELMKSLRKAKSTVKDYGHTVKGTRAQAIRDARGSASANLEELSKFKPTSTKGRKVKWEKRRRAEKRKLESAAAGLPAEEAATSKARKQVAGGFAGLAGLAALGIGAKAVSKRSAKKSVIKGTRSAAERLGRFAKKNKRTLAIGGGAVGGAAALGAILKSKKK